jgi:membrane associated rhomboid family serine protease
MQPFVRRWQAGRPSATALVVSLSIGFFAAQWLVDMFLTEGSMKGIFTHWLALDGASIEHRQWWKFVTFGLLHNGLQYLAANMLLLFFAGREVESLLGPKHFLAIYGLGNLVGGVAHFFAMRSEPLMGVSAGVAAVVVAFTTILPELEITVNLFFVIPLRLRAKYLAYALLAVCGLCWWTLTGLEMGPVGMIAGSLFGWAYVKQLGYGNPLPIQRYIFEKRQRAARLERMSADQFLSAEIDPILEKIAQHGMKSLTRAERKILEQGRDKLDARTTPKN